MSASETRTSRDTPWLVLARLGAIGAAALAADVAFDPQQRSVPLCPFHSATGLWCPLCGGLRSANALAHGRLGEGLHDNVLLIAGLVLLTLWAGEFIVRARSGARPRRFNRAAVAALVVVLLVFTVVRNLPIGHALAPR